MIARRRAPRAFVSALILGASWLLGGPASPARAQESAPPPPPPPPQAEAAQPPAPGQQDSTATEHPVTSTSRHATEGRDRFELGGGVVKGFFDTVGSIGYRRFLGQGPALQQNLMLELTGSAKDQLTEGALSIYVLMRPSATYRESWRLRPLIEFGPAAHTVFQVASLEGLGRTRYKSQVYLKTHAYAGFEALLTHRMGLLVRGRVSVPSHRPFDYAQAAIFLR